MLTALIALPFAAQLVTPAAFAEASAASVFEQSQFTRPSQAAETMRFRNMDANNDGVVTRAEWRGSEQSFRVHDWNGDGILSGDEVRQGAVRPSDQARPDSGIRDDREDTFENLDVNRNNQIERHEWHASADAFQWLDRNRDGVLSRREMVGGGGNRSAVARNQGRTAVGTSGSANCETNPAKVVDDIYQQVLERPADQASDGTTQALAGGRLTVRDIVAQLARSEEHAGRFVWRPVGTSIYRQLLKREPSQEELQRMTFDLTSGQRQLSDVIGRTARRAANSDEDAVRILYRYLLGREADEQGLRGYTDLARREGIEVVARDIMKSDEYRQRAGASGVPSDIAAAYESAARSVYRHILGRDPDSNASRRVAQMLAAGDMNGAVDFLLNGADYQRLYGTDAVPGRGSAFCS